MASNRHLGRIIALQTLYEYEFRERANDTPDVEEILTRNLDRYEKAIDDKEFVHILVKGVIKNASILDARLTPIAPDWPIAQIAGVDRAILRMSLFELENVDSVPPKVVINEAVELAKSFGSENSSKFINGVLGTIYRQIAPEQEEQPNGSAGQEEE